MEEKIYVRDQLWHLSENINQVDDKKSDFFGYVYALEYDNKIKIGKTKNIFQRMKTIKTYAEKYADIETGVFLYSLPHVNYHENEKILHDYFKDYRIEGTELFNLSILDFTKMVPKLNFDFDCQKIEKENFQSYEQLKNLIISTRDKYSYSVEDMLIELLNEIKKIKNENQILKDELEVLSTIQNYR